MIIGAHVSVAGGFIKALDYALSVGCECMQFFAKSPRQWKGPATDPDIAQAFIAERKARGFGPVFTHTAYLISLSTSDDELRAKSVIALADELRRARLLGASGVVTHIGNDRAADPSAAAARAGDAVLQAMREADALDQPIRLLLENTAGAGASFGADIAEISACIDRTGLPAELLGMCLDTCHGFAHGMCLDTEAGWRQVLDEIESLMGMDRLGLVHANDCMFERGAKRDRHAWIGDGLIGESGFAAMMCMTQLKGVALVTEMPGDPPEKDSVNNQRLRAMRDACAPSQS